MPTDTEIAIQGCGIVTPFAAGPACDVLSRAGLPPQPPESGYWPVPDSTLDRYPSLDDELKRERAGWIAAAALLYACEDARLSLDQFKPDRICLVIGCTFSGQLGMLQFADEVRQQSARFVSPIHFPQTVGNYVAGALSRAFKIQGPNLTVADGPTSGLSAVRTACDLLAEDAADVAIAGGAETLSDTIVRGLTAGPHRGPGAPAPAEGACLYVLRRADRIDATHSRAIITTWSNDGSAAPDSYSVAARVGFSFAAESAMRLAAAIQSVEPDLVRTVVHTGNGSTGQTMVVRVHA
ncbi:MAG: hypothetical protein HOP29_03700 [Phycisphaerales bacterium]|nr:hypothetical protein [Phycisphaerales bacterium]